MLSRIELKIKNVKLKIKFCLLNLNFVTRKFGIWNLEFET